MKKIIITTILFLAFFTIYAQEKISYRTNIGNIQFEISEKEVYTEFSFQDANKVEVFVNKKFQKINLTSATIELDNLTGKFIERKQQLKTQLPNLIKIEPVLIFTDGVKQIATGEINLKLKNDYKISEITKQYSFEVIPLSITPNFFTLSNKNISTEELFNIVDKLQQDYRVEFAEPNFIRLLKPFTNDPFFNSQWAIINQGYLGGTIGADMKVEQAWNIATGSATKVAIIDEGVDLTHPDLQTNLLTGFDATGNNSNGAPNSSLNDAHGTACAGIVAAVANNITGIAGVAYNSRVIPIRIAYSNGYPLGDFRRAWVTNDNWIASGISWAWQNGADVLSNSWGGGSYSNTIATAVTNAVTNGRNGKGCVVLFASGNNNGAVSFPASLDNVIAVGASSMCDQRKSPTSCDGEPWWGGNFGAGLDVMAPGVKIYATDIHGSAGYNSGDYRADFNGTSSACPNAAAVVALILSVNSNLTGQQARNILENSCDKVGGYSYQSNIAGQPNGTWSNDAGYGRVNAQKAVCVASNQLLTISGISYICNSDTYSINTNSNVTWSATPAGQITLTPSGNQVIVTRIGNANAIITLTANLSPGCTGLSPNATKQIVIGKGANAIVYNNCTISCNPNGAYLNANIIPIGEGTICNWYAKNNSIANSQFVFLENAPWGTDYPLRTQTRKYTIRAEVINACGTLIGDQVISLPSCTGGGTNRMIIASPNPATNNISIQITDEQGKVSTDPNDKIYELQVVDKLGNIYKQIKFNEGVNQPSINISNLKPDIYFIKAFNGTDWMIEQIIKQ